MTSTIEQTGAEAGAPVAPEDGIAPPARPDAPARSGLRGLVSRTAVTEVLRPVRRGKVAGDGSGGRPPRTPRLSSIPAAPRQLAPRDGRWWFGAALLTVSMLLLGFVAQVTLLSGLQHQRDQLIAYDELRASLAKAETPVGQLGIDEEMVAPGTPVARIQIPAIGLDEVVMEGTSSEVLRTGVGHRRDSVMPGQAGTAVLLGRQLTYGGPFGSLTRLQPGDDITVTTGQGEHVFRVIGLRVAGDPMPAELTSGQGRLELQTAAGLPLFPSGVLYVDAELISKTAQNPSRVMGYPALPVEERAMGQAPGGWFAVFFALVFFVAAGIGAWWLWTRWGRWHAWLISVPVLLALGVIVADTTMDALPNLL